jgi:hypothetical protein
MNLDSPFQATNRKGTLPFEESFRNSKRDENISIRNSLTKTMDQGAILELGT